MLQERGRGAVLVGVARVDAALERLLQAVLLPTAGRNDSLFQADRPLGSFGARIGLAHRQAYQDGRANPLWAPLESVLTKAGGANTPPVDPTLRDYILLITILVAFLEATGLAIHDPVNGQGGRRRLLCGSS